jgi:hypothetical protein
MLATVLAGEMVKKRYSKPKLTLLEGGKPDPGKQTGYPSAETTTESEY